MQIADTQHNWVDSTIPERFVPYVKLARLDRPIGTWLALWPCLWALILASRLKGHIFPDGMIIILVTTGAILMRGAGCTLNDILDRAYDRRVRRNMNRPLACNQISLRAAIFFLFLQLLFAAEILFFFNRYTVYLGLTVLPFVAVYPLMKRFTFWPQLWLGVAFNWGALIGWSILWGSLDLRAVFIYVASLFWTMGYDTIYAHQDKEDDALLGLKSTALLFGSVSKLWVSIFYTTAWLLLTLSHIHFSFMHILASFLMLVHLGWQIHSLDIYNADSCLATFRSNRNFGAIAALYFLT